MCCGAGGCGPRASCWDRVANETASIVKDSPRRWLVYDNTHTYDLTTVETTWKNGYLIQQSSRFAHFIKAYLGPGTFHHRRGNVNSLKSSFGGTAAPAKHSSDTPAWTPTP